MALVMWLGWAMTGANGNQQDTMLKVPMGDEFGVAIGMKVIMETGRKVIDGITGTLTANEKNSGAKKHWYVHGGKWLELASQLQAVVHDMIVEKGDCRR
mgnify:CR=1 FL=1